MKIEGNRPNQLSRTDEAPQAQQLERTQSGRAGKDRSAAQSGDRVEVSGDAHLMSSALAGRQQGARRFDRTLSSGPDRNLRQARWATTRCAWPTG